jgi:hypothetical protein
LRRREGSNMSEDDNGRDKPTNGRRGRRPVKGRASSTIARPKAPQRPRVARRTVRKASEEQVQPRETAERAGEAAAVETTQADEHVTAPDPEGEGVSAEKERDASSGPESGPPAERAQKRKSPSSKARTAKGQASVEAKHPPQERGKAGGQPGAPRQRAGGRRTRVDTSGPAAPNAGPVKPASPEPFDQPTVDPMADLAGLAEQSLRDSLQSLRSVSESRTLSELLERQSRHMRLMTEIWMRQAQRSMEVFNAMLSQRRK